MLKTFLAASATLSLVACVKQDETAANIDKVLPTTDQVSIKLKDSTGAAARLGRSDALGQLATWYVATRDVTRTFNGGTGWVLTLIHAIVQFPVTSTKGNTSTWGPWHDGPLSPAEYKLDVTAVGDGTYTYQLSGRSRTQANAAFEVVIDGKADPRLGDAKGNGEFLVDFDAGRRVNPIDAGDAKGTVDARYDLTKRHLDLAIMSTDAAGKATMAEYAYNEAADGGGDMQLGVSANLGGGAANETITLHSRWQATGAGRADARVSGGDLGTASATASECWSTSFQETYYTDSANFLPTAGSAASCVFATADLPPAK
jgi:hypothetical protein